MRLLLIFIFLLFGINFSYSQNPSLYTISGRVLDGEIPVGSVVITSSSNQTVSFSDKNGYFLLKLPAEKHKLFISLLGFKSKTLEINVIENLDLGEIQLQSDSKALNELVVTGQFSPQSVRNSVYNVRVINHEQIKLRGATNIQGILNTELGMRFSNDLTLGTSDVELMGMSGQNVKILLDGVPVIDRGSTRESLGQIDINNVEKIEIVEGPMSVNYGSDALAGVINVITKKANPNGTITLSARLLEETSGSEYSAFKGVGTHNAYLGAAWQRNNFDISAGFTRNFFGGWQGNAEGRKMTWMPKEQYLPYAQIGYRKNKFSSWYRFNGTDETLKSLGNTYTNTNNNHASATDQYYITKRWFHQLQSEVSLNAKNSISLAASYTDYSRATQTTDLDLETNRRTQSLSGSQDKSLFKTSFLRLTGQHKLSQKVSVQHGLESNLNSASGERISGSPSINDYAYFISSEFKLTHGINLRPGLRFIKNSVYDAPPVIPSINTKFRLNEKLDLRLAYARGFRSPALRELYFTFFDASHSIKGNENLKAETSNSFNSFLSYQILDNTTTRFNSTLGVFYNVFDNLISIGIDPANTSVNTYLNVDKYKTAGTTLNNTLYHNNLLLTLGFSWIGRYNRFSETDELAEFMWTPEVNSNIRYNFPKINSSVSLFFKYTGKLPRYVAQTTTTGIVPTKTEIQGYSMADLTFNKVFFKHYTLNLGVKNLFDITTLSNTNQDSGVAHSSGGAVPMSYGRSYFAGINIQLTR